MVWNPDRLLSEVARAPSTRTPPAGATEVNGVRLVNTSVVHTRTVRIRGGRFGADRIVRVSATAETPGTFPGPSGSYRAPENPPRTVTWGCDDDVVIELPPAHGADLDLTIARGAGTPRLHPSGGAA